MSLNRCKNILFAPCSLLPVLCTILIISGCVSTDEVRRIKWDLNSLKDEVKKIKKTSQSIETQMPGQTKQLDSRLKDIEETQKATAATVSNLLIEHQKLTSEFQILTGSFEESRYFSEKSAAELSESKGLLTAKVKELELAVDELKKKLPLTGSQDKVIKEEDAGAQGAETGTKAEEETKKQTGEPEKTGGSDVKDAYMAAYQIYKEGRTVEAREKFMSMLNTHPENEYSDNARFWVGESYYNEESYEDAILAYEELFKKNPESDKVPGAMLKQGLAFLALKDKKTGNIVLEKLIEKFPDSEEAKLAAKKINKTVPPKKTK